MPRQSRPLPTQLSSVSQTGHLYTETKIRSLSLSCSRHMEKNPSKRLRLHRNHHRSIEASVASSENHRHVDLLPCHMLVHCRTWRSWSMYFLLLLPAESKTIAISFVSIAYGMRLIRVFGLDWKRLAISVWFLFIARMELDHEEAKVVGCRTPVACPPTLKKKSVYVKQRKPPKQGYFQPPNLEALFLIAPRSEASYAWILKKLWSFFFCIFLCKIMWNMWVCGFASQC